MTRAAKHRSKRKSVQGCWQEQLRQSLPFIVLRRLTGSQPVSGGSASRFFSLVCFQSDLSAAVPIGLPAVASSWGPMNGGQQTSDKSLRRQLGASNSSPPPQLSPNTMPNCCNSLLVNSLSTHVQFINSQFLSIRPTNSHPHCPPHCEFLLCLFLVSVGRVDERDLAG